MFSEIGAWVNARCTILDDTTVYAGSNIAREALIREPLCIYGLILHVAYSSMHQHQSRHQLNSKIDNFSQLHLIAYFVTKLAAKKICLRNFFTNFSKKRACNYMYKQ